MTKEDTRPERGTALVAGIFSGPVVTAMTVGMVRRFPSLPHVAFVESVYPVTVRVQQQRAGFGANPRGLQLRRVGVA